MRHPVPAALLLLAACAPPDIGSVDALIRAASPIAWAGTLAWAAAGGVEGPCIRAEAPGVWTLAPGIGCSPALGAVPSGEALVTALEVSPDALLFAAVFDDLAVDARPPVLEEVGAATVTPRTGGLLVAWADTDITVDGAAAEVVQGAWVVAVDTGATPSDLGDDAWTLQGARQWVAGGPAVTAVIESGLALAVTTPSCRLNPISGTAGIEAVRGSATDVGVDVGTVHFHEACDGRATFVGAGSSGLSAGEEVDLLGR